MLLPFILIIIVKKMNVFKRCLPKFSNNFSYYVKYSTSLNNCSLFEFKSNFTTEEQYRILKVLNTSSSDELTKFKLSQTRIKNLQSWKSKKGPFKTLNEVLEVDGLGEKVLEKICENIQNTIGNESTPLPVKDITLPTSNRRHRPILLPTLCGTVANNLKLAIGVHLSTTGVSWAILNRTNNNLVEWNFDNYGAQLPKKMFLNDTFDLALQILNKIPPADVYVFENSSSIAPSSTLQPAAVTSYVQHLELLAMLIALINTSSRHNSSLQTRALDEDSQKVENRVFHLKANVPARMFNTFIGSEKVAAESVISELLEENSQQLTLPCTPIVVSQEIKSSFYCQLPQNRELLGQALMLIVTFMDLCVYKNPKSLTSLIPGKRNK